MAKKKETRTEERNADCYRVYCETIKEIKDEYPADVAQSMTITAISERAVMKQPLKFHLSPEHFMTCVHNHEKMINKSTHIAKK